MGDFGVGREAAGPQRRGRRRCGRGRGRQVGRRPAPRKRYTPRFGGGAPARFGSASARGRADIPGTSRALPRHGHIVWLGRKYEVGRGHAMTAAAPSGVVTFLFTDVEGSTRRWEADADAMRAALLAHDEVQRDAIVSHGAFCSATPGT